MLLHPPMLWPTTSERASSRVLRILSPPGTSPTPVWPELSVRMTRLRVKNGACAPLRLRSMLSRPATGITSIAVTIGAPEIPPWTIGCSFLCLLLFGRLSGRSRGGQFLHERGQFRHLLRGEIGQRRTHGAGVAADHLHARLDDRDRIALLAVADRDQRQDEVLQPGVDRLVVALADRGVEPGRKFGHEVE